MQRFNAIYHIERQACASCRCVQIVPEGAIILRISGAIQCSYLD